MTRIFKCGRKGGKIIAIKTPFPEFCLARQSFSNHKVENLLVATKTAVQNMHLAEKISLGDNIAITVGSRGIANIPEILKLLVEEIRALGGTPFLVAAMGSHGGGTSSGMRQVLDDLGINKKRTGAPILSSNQTVMLGETVSDFKVYCAKEAVNADGIIVVNRIKPHTSLLAGNHASGLLKMLSVGLGRTEGAVVAHAVGVLGMGKSVLEVGAFLLNKLPVLGGLAIVENANEETAVLEGFPAEEIIQKDRELLIKARELSPALPLDFLDFLIVREMGKEFSGTGMDTNVIGRLRLDEIPDPAKPSITRLAVLDLSAASHGNANGIGLADFTTQKLFDKIDFEVTYLNGFTTNFLRRVMLPIILPTVRDVIKKGLASLNLPDREPRVMVIHNTSHLAELYVSHSLEEEIRRLDHLTVIERGIGLEDILRM